MGKKSLGGTAFTSKAFDNDDHCYQEIQQLWHTLRAEQGKNAKQ